MAAPDRATMNISNSEHIGSFSSRLEQQAEPLSTSSLFSRDDGSALKKKASASSRVSEGEGIMAVM